MNGVGTAERDVEATPLPEHDLIFWVCVKAATIGCGANARKAKMVAA